MKNNNFLKQLKLLTQKPMQTLVIGLGLAMTSNSFSTEINLLEQPLTKDSLVPAREVYCNLRLNSRNSGTLILSSTISIDGKSHFSRGAFVMAYIPVWNRKLSYNLKNNESIEIDVYATEHVGSGDYLIQNPNLVVTLSVLKDQHPIAKTSVTSRTLSSTPHPIHGAKMEFLTFDINLFIPSTTEDAEIDRKLSLQCWMPKTYKL